jgi:hypothetical protein
MERMAHVKYKYLLLEFDYLDIVNQQPPGRVPAATVYGTHFAFAVKYGISPLFCNSHSNARAVLYKLFQYYTKYEILKIK